MRPTSPIGTHLVQRDEPGEIIYVETESAPRKYPVTEALAKVWATAYRAGHYDEKAGWWLRNPYCADGCICGECDE